MGFWKALALWIEKLVNGMEKLHFIVSDKILLVDRTKAVPTLEELTEWPPIFEKTWARTGGIKVVRLGCLLYTSPSPRDLSTSRMPSSA